MFNYYIKLNPHSQNRPFLVHIVPKPNTRTFWGTLKICLEVETIVGCVSVNNYLSCCVNAKFFTLTFHVVFFFVRFTFTRQYAIFCHLSVNHSVISLHKYCTTHYPRRKSLLQEKKENIVHQLFISDFGFL
jgi:hypothetical protein